MEDDSRHQLSLTSPLLMIKKDYQYLVTKRNSSSNSWIFYSLAASVIFTSCNLFMVELSKEGLYGYLFFCYGTLFASVCFFIKRMHD